MELTGSLSGRIYFYQLTAVRYPSRSGPPTRCGRRATTPGIPLHFRRERSLSYTHSVVSPRVPPLFENRSLRYPFVLECKRPVMA